MPNSHAPPPHTTKQSCLCVVSGEAVRIGQLLLMCSDFKFSVGVSLELSPDKCVLRRSASGGRTLVGRSGRLNSHHHTRHDKTVLSVSCLVCRCELDDCSERVQTLNFLSATVLSCRESNSQRRGGRDTDKTVLSCLAWRCELAFIRHHRAQQAKGAQNNQAENICLFVCLFVCLFISAHPERDTEFHKKSTV